LKELTETDLILELVNIDREINGIDLSKVRLTDMTKMLDSKSIKEKYAPAWINAAHKEVKIKDIRKYHKKDEVTYRYGIIEKRYTLLSDDFVIAEDYSFPIDTVKNMIKNYKLDEKEGIGYVVIAENFNKPKERLYTHHMFFDIKSRELLWAVKVDGRPAGIAFSAYWGEGIAHNILFETKIYKKRMRKLR